VTRAADIADTLAEEGYGLIDLSGDAHVLALCDEVVAQTGRWHARGRHRVQDAWRRSPAVRDLAGLRQITDELERAYGAKPFPFQTLNFLCGTQQRAHSDMVHFTQEPAHLMCAVWFALEDIEEDAGPLFYYPGSHRLPVLSLEDAGAPKSLDARRAYGAFYEPAMEERMQRASLTRRTALLKKGQAFVWAANLVHGGAPVQKQNATRRSQVTHYFFEGGEYYTLMHSRGRRAHRLPADIRTGRFVWPVRGRPSLRTTAAAIYARLSRRVIC
jgi:hypothetical protein